jgi:hypothetical protein
MNKVNNNKFKSNGVLLKKNFFNSATPYKIILMYFSLKDND